MDIHTARQKRQLDLYRRRYRWGPIPAIAQNHKHFYRMIEIGNFRVKTHRRFVITMNHLGSRELKTERLCLRQFRPQDMESCLQNWAADEAVFQCISQSPMSREQMEAFLAGADSAYADPATYYWAIEVREERAVIGEIFVDDFSECNQWCEIDYKLGPAYWNQGYGTEALRAVLDYLLNQVGFHRVQAKCASGNAASERVMQKAGMVREGWLRGYFLRKDGTGFDDVVLYALLNHECSSCYKKLPQPPPAYSCPDCT